MTTISAPISTVKANKTQSQSQSCLAKIASWIYTYHCASSSSLRPSAINNPVRIVCVSDTHTTQPTLPGGDLLIHAGDLSANGSFEEIQEQLNWLNSQPHPHKVVISGNHDLLLDPDFVDRYPHRIIEREGTARNDLCWGSLIYLSDQSATIKCSTRSIKVYGSPWTAQFGNWAFQVPPIRDIWTRTVPDDTDILITHGPPKYHLDDQACGSRFLGKELCRVRPRLVVFGHVHCGYGKESVSFDVVKDYYDDIRDSEGEFWVLFKMIWNICLCKVLYLFARDVGRESVESRRITKLVNASAVRGIQNQERNEPIVVEI